nr:replication protein A 70 kDa DNA-binding subunit B [Tanacetum cinerariifolium]
MQKVFEKGYLRRESAANTLPGSGQRKLLSRESKEMLRRKVKEIEAYNASNVRAEIKEKENGKATTRKDKRARCYPAVNNALFGSKLYINTDLPEMNAFRQRYQEQESYGEDDYRIALFTPDKPVVTVESFFKDTVKTMIDGIRDCEQGTHCVVYATIHRIHREHGWCYLACKECSRKVDRVLSKALVSSANRNLKQAYTCENHVYLRRDVLEPLPPIIVRVKIDLLGLYKMVDSMGGYLSVSLGNKWKDVVMIYGLPEEHNEDLKECYKRTIDLVKCYYETTLRDWYKEGLVKYEETKEVEIGCDHAKEGNPQEHVRSNRSELRVVKDNTRERFKNVQGGETHFGVILEGDNETDGDQVTSQNDGGNTSENDDFVVIT